MLRLRTAILVLLVLTCCLTATLPASAQSCVASASWVNNPQLPTSINPTSLCSFFQFSWQEFLALVEPAGLRTGQLVFETYMSADGVFVADGQTPLAWGNEPWPLTLGGITKQAGSGFDLIAQSGAEVQFDLSFNEAMYDYVVGNKLYNQNCFLAGAGSTSIGDIHLPPTTNVPTTVEAIELKTAWLPMAKCDPAKYHCTIAKVNNQATAVGLIGIHIVQKLPNHQEWIWSTFEHVANAPQCTPVSDLPSGYSNWNFFNKSFVAAGQDCEPCPNPEDPTGEDSGDVACDVATQCNVWINESAEPNICRVADLLPDVTSINQSVWSLLPKSSVWRNYMLVGSVWFNPGLTQPTAASGPLAGSTGLSNSVMESYTQNTGSSQQNCFTCHTSSYKSTMGNQHADFSHMFSRIQQTETITCPTLTQPSHGNALAPVPPVKAVGSHGSN